MVSFGSPRASRRAVLRGAVGAAAAVAVGGGARAWQATPGATAATPALGELAIDLIREPGTLDPALAYEADAWSIVHSVYDALVQFTPDGQLEPVLAEGLTWTDPQTLAVRLRSGVRFHNGEALGAGAVALALRHLTDPKTGSQVAGLFGVVKEVAAVAPLTVQFRLTQPAPWLPAQMAQWLVALPPAYAANPANDFAARPVGTGPYRFASWQRGQQIRLGANPDYFAASPKGRPLAERVAYRFVPEAATRVADLLSGTAGLVRDVPVDQAAAVGRGGAKVAISPVAGSAWVRIATDTKPFDDPRVRLALNHAVDVDAIIQALLGGHGQRLPNFFVPGGLGFDPSLAPHAHDPNLARQLLQQAGATGLTTTIAFASGERQDLVEAIAGMLGDVGIKASVEAVELARFNATWTDKSTAPLRFSTWRPLFDPYTLLVLVVSAKGFLSRHSNPNAQPLIEAGAIEPDPTKRAAIYRQLGRVLRDEPAAIYLYNLTALDGTAATVSGWSPRPDEFILPLAGG